jgi:tetratricopeptide (TPR) repeat protein
VLIAQNRLAQQERCLSGALQLATLSGVDETIFALRRLSFRQLATIGKWADAKFTWDLLNPMGRDWSRSSYRPGNAEYDYALFRFWQGALSEENLSVAEQLANVGKNRKILRDLHGLRAEWHLERSQWQPAVDSLQEAISMARAVGQVDSAAEARLALARFHLGQLADPRGEAEQLASAAWVSNLALADLWLAIGDHEQAKKHALAAYKSAWADGEPFVFRYELNKARTLLEKLGAEIPNLPPYDPAKDGKFPCEDEVVAAVEKLRAEKAAHDRDTGKSEPYLF